MKKIKRRVTQRRRKVPQSLNNEDHLSGSMRFYFAISALKEDVYSDQISLREVFLHFGLDFFCLFAGYLIELFAAIGKDNPP
jgi:hypothetical protein